MRESIDVNNLSQKVKFGSFTEKLHHIPAGRLGLMKAKRHSAADLPAVDYQAGGRELGRAVRVSIASPAPAGATAAEAAPMVLDEAKK